MITKKQIDTLHNTMIEYESSYNTILELNELGFIEPLTYKDLVEIKRELEKPEKKEE